MHTRFLTTDVPVPTSDAVSPSLMARACALQAAKLIIKTSKSFFMAAPFYLPQQQPSEDSVKGYLQDNALADDDDDDDPPASNPAGHLAHPA